MTITATNAFSGPFTANGSTTTFPFTFAAMSASEVLVVRRSETGDTVFSDGYTVTLTPGGGGSVVFTTAPVTGEIYLFSSPSFEQQTTFANQGSFSPTALNEAFDRAAVRDVALNFEVGRTMKVPLDEVAPDYPSAASRAGAYLTHDEYGNPIPGITLTGIEAIEEAAAENAAANATLQADFGALSSAVALLSGNLNAILSFSGITHIYNTKADASAATGIIAENEVIMVLSDETVSNRRTLYRKEGGLLILRAQVDQPGPVFVSSPDGNDGDLGTSPNTAFATFAHTEAVGAADVTLVDGSLFRESLTEPGRVTVVPSEYDEVSIVAADDVVTGWTAHATAANVWEKASFTHNAPPATDRLTIYENGELLVRVANVATCSSTPGSFVDVRASDGFVVTLQMHPTVSGNPNFNGRVYEASARLEGIHLDDNAKVYGPVVVRRAITGSGPLRVGINSRVARVLAKDGTKHNFFMGSGIARDCVACDNDASPPADEPSATMFVSFNGVTTGLAYLYERCFAVRPFDGKGGTTAWLAHSDANATNYASGILRQCGVIGTQNLGHPGGVDAANALLEGCFTKTGTLGPGFGTANYCMAYSPYVNAETNLMGEFGACNVNHFAAYLEERAANGNNNEIMRIRNTTSIATSVFVGSSSTGTTNFIANSNPTGTLTFTHSINYRLASAFIIPTGQSYVGDYNVYFIRNNFLLSSSFIGTYHGVQYNSLSTWQTATGQDAHSVYLDAADQIAGGANAFWLAYANAEAATALSTIGPAIGDYRINPNARVYSSNGTAHIGQFADGTPITTAGPQAYWDWNARGVRSGPPPAAPTIPSNDDDGLVYISAPRGWNHYPALAA